jgi:hypothetical protein
VYVVHGNHNHFPFFQGNIFAVRRIKKHFAGKTNNKLYKIMRMAVHAEIFRIFHNAQKLEWREKKFVEYP